MALVQPTNLFPSSFRGSGGDVIDASQNNTFSLQINGTSACVAYALEIMQNDTSSTSVYSINKTTLTNPIYPRNYKNEPQRLEITIPSTSGMTNGYANGYKWNVTLYWGGATDDESITSADTFFVAQANPYFTVTDPPTTLTEKQLSLAATYTQSDGVPLEWYRWVLTDADGNTIEDTGEIYSEDIQFNVDGLLNGNTYTYTLTGQTQSGVTVPTITGSFDVEYTAPAVSGSVTTSCNNKTGAITVSYPSVYIITGKGTGSYDYQSNQPISGDTSIELGEGATIVFDEINDKQMTVEGPTTHVWSGRPLAQGILYEFVETYENQSTIIGQLVYSNGYLQYWYDGVKIFEIYRLGFAERWAIVVMYQNTVAIQLWRRSNTLYPNTTLYPSTTLYPFIGNEWANDGRFYGRG